MTALIDSLVKEIAVKHGISIGRDDPILILQTLNAKLTEENAKSQQIMLHQFKEEMEGISLRWESGAKEKAERILNASLTASKEAMATLLQENSELAASLIRKKVDESLALATDKLHRAKQIAIFNVIGSTFTFLAVCGVILTLLFQ